MDETEFLTKKEQEFEKLPSEQRNSLIDRAAFLVAHHYIDKGDKSLYELAVEIHSKTSGLFDSLP